jgi:hypothetical protein
VLALILAFVRTILTIPRWVRTTAGAPSAYRMVQLLLPWMGLLNGRGEAHDEPRRLTMSPPPYWLKPHSFEEWQIDLPCVKVAPSKGEPCKSRKR